MNDKPFKTYEELVCKLRDEKKMTVPDEEHVIALLKKHSYFALVSGYKTLFKQPNGEYLPSTTIDDLLALFEFDNNMRDIFFHAIQIIEKHIKSLLSHAFVSKYGYAQEEYLNPNNYMFIGSSENDTYVKCTEVKRLVQTFDKIVKPPFDHHSYIKHQQTAHNNVPLWVAIKAVTFGTASKMYSLCTQDVQASVSREFPSVTEHKLIGMLDLLTRVRNVCAHNERLYDFNTDRRSIQKMPLHKQLGIGKRGIYLNKGQSDLFAAVVCFKYLLSPEEFASTAEAINSEIKQLCTKTKKIQENKILSCMGFPHNWYDSIKY